MANDRYFALGKKASLFYDPSTGLKLLPGMAVKQTAKLKRSKKISVALKGGHLEYIDSGEKENYKIVSLENETKKDDSKKEKEDEPKPGEEGFDTKEPEDGWDKDSLDKHLKPHLYNLAIHYGTEVAREGIKEIF